MKRQNLITVEWTLAPNARRPAERAKPEVLGRLPRITRLMALAIKFEQMIRDGIVRDYADLARLGLVTPARLTQIMNLTNLAPDLQQEILFLDRVTEGKDPIAERSIRSVVRHAEWDRQRESWRRLRNAAR